MKVTTLSLSLFALIGAGCAMDPSSPVIATSSLQDCFAANYDAQRDLFTIRNSAQDSVNEQCLLTIGSRSEAAPRPRVSAGSYAVSIANGGGGGAGGNVQLDRGGGGGGGAGARETQMTVELAAGIYKLTIGAGGPGGHACVPAYNMGGGPGWAGSPSSIVRAVNGEVIAGTPGAERYARPSRARHDQSTGSPDGRGGSGPGQASGGQGGSSTAATGAIMLAESGEGSRGTGAPSIGGNYAGNAERWLAGGGSGPTTNGDGNGFAALSSAGFDAPTAQIGRDTTDSVDGGTPGGNEDRTSAGGGGGATNLGRGGGGGGESPGHANRPPHRGSLGSGGGGGEGSRFGCDAGARGGHGYIALRPI